MGFSARAGLRDRAIVLVLARLGLRAGEAARLRLDDIDWPGGLIAVAGKGSKSAQLPLPVDVGRAIADYLRVRPATAVGRTVFVRAKAPHRALSTGGVTQAVAAASNRAGLGVLFAHRLRHTAATSMLAGGAALPEVAQVLRHERLLTTANYARVDVEALRVVARAWDGGRG
jgi:integrase/recombinase XerD